MSDVNLSKAALAVVGAILMSGGVATAEQVRHLGQSQEAAAVLKDLIEKGYVSVDSASGTLKLEKSVLEVLKAAGVASEAVHGTTDSTLTGGGGRACGSVID